jgi:ElaB/YqjD/DUF883 family membrane-anchored ribosome-binding protein
MEYKSSVERFAHEMKEKVEDAGGRVASQLDRGRESAAQKMDEAAAAISRKAAEFPVGKGLADTLDHAAHRIEGGARYLREHDVDTVLNDAREKVRMHPGGALAVAAVAGFALGLLLTRNRESL